MGHTRTAFAHPSSILVSMLCSLTAIAASSTTEASPLSVRLVQLSGGTAVSGTQTFITAALQVSGSLASPLTTSAFGSNLSWTASGTGVTNANLYTVTPAGTPFVGSGAMAVNSPGFLYYDGLGTPVGSMNTTNLDPSFQRYVAVDADPLYYPTLSGSFSNVTVATINFAVSSGIRIAEFDFALNGDAPNRGFFNDEFTAVTFDDGGGKLVVVPEPDVAPAFFAIGLVAIVSRLHVRRTRQQSRVFTCRAA